MENRIIAVAGHSQKIIVEAIASALPSNAFAVNNHEVKDQMRQKYLNTNPDPIEFIITSTNSLEPKSGRENRRERRAKERKNKN